VKAKASFELDANLKASSFIHQKEKDDHDGKDSCPKTDGKFS
jgi:hypothetical protein